MARPVPENLSQPDNNPQHTPPTRRQIWRQRIAKVSWLLLQAAGNTQLESLRGLHNNTLPPQNS